MRLSIVFMASIAAVTNAYAMDKTGKYAGYETYKVVECADYENYKSDQMKTALAQNYIEGWLTAYNVIRNDNYSIAQDKNISSIMFWLKRYCDNHPLESIVNGLMEFSITSYPTRWRVPPLDEK